uniref:hypothetical protein n=1 Tax=Brachyspira catarrhinii TaxID=2528966 RepID=UPI003F4C899B
MNKIKKILIVIFSLIFVNAVVFAESGFEAIIDVPIGASFTLPIGKAGVESGNNSYINVKNLNGKINASAGVAVKLGYLFDVYDDMGISALAEIGYQYNSYTSFINIENVGTLRVIDSLTKNIRTHSIKLGLLPKFNKGNFSLGLGFGVKIPLYVIRAGEIAYMTDVYHKDQYVETLNFNNIKDSYKIPVIAYIKLTADYSVFFVDNIAFNLGVYLNYDFGLQDKNSDLREDAIEFGFQLGTRFAPKLE